MQKVRYCSTPNARQSKTSRARELMVVADVGRYTILHFALNRSPGILYLGRSMLCRGSWSEAI